ncbi:hypothetical protein CWE13_02125 [Aliidiomarina shirensis]|uniref:Glycosyl transferase family 2 n=1 Tax=Aliidiomarina shirensis TaxID=1048642 RepID=A0A432WXE0_9GAMM|nr:hypothetical protein [Aliidiomarina shirensis]RUO38458.1 hypothetical protein CWE13_02125 [Aliidiomarina shirensis]
MLENENQDNRSTGGQGIHLCVVIPVAPEENQHTQLLADLEQLAFVFQQHEIALTVSVVSAGGRAKSLNQGAERSADGFIWFLHADSRITAENVRALALALKRQTSLRTIFYFNLYFREGGLARLNAIGANLRSRLFSAPYGDQGFCMHRSLWKRLGGYREDVAYAEDLLFVQAARKVGAEVVRVPSTLSSSARKYQQQGWLHLTLRYQRIYWKLTFKNRWQK